MNYKNEKYNSKAIKFCIIFVKNKMYINQRIIKMKSIIVDNIYFFNEFLLNFQQNEKCYRWSIDILKSIVVK